MDCKNKIFIRNNQIFLYIFAKMTFYFYRKLRKTVLSLGSYEICYYICENLMKWKD